MAKRYRVEYNRKGCIGAFMCSFIDPDHFKENYDDSKVDMVGDGVRKEGDIFVMEVEGNLEDMGNLVRRAADSCPAGVIRIFDLETGQRIAGHPFESEKAEEEARKNRKEQV